MRWRKSASIRGISLINDTKLVIIKYQSHIPLPHSNVRPIKNPEKQKKKRRKPYTHRIQWLSVRPADPPHFHTFKLYNIARFKQLRMWISCHRIKSKHLKSKISSFCLLICAHRSTKSPHTNRPLCSVLYSSPMFVYQFILIRNRRCRSTTAKAIIAVRFELFLLIFVAFDRIRDILVRIRVVFSP